MKVFAIAFAALIAFAPLAVAGDGPDLTTCTSCTDIESALFPTPTFQTVTGTTVGFPNGEYSYEFCAVGGQVYEFTFCRSGGSATYDSDLSIWNAVAGPRCGPTSLICNDDFCSLQSELVWTAPASGQYVLRVAGFGSAVGTYVLAYRGTPCAVPVDPSTWGTIKSMYN